MAGYDLKAALKRVTTKPSNFVLIKGTKGEQVYIGPQPPNAKQLAPLVEECGAGKRLAAGICLLEKDQLVFATKSAPSPAWAALATKVLKAAQCGQYLPAGWRQLGEKESAEASADGSEAKGEAARPPGTADPAAAQKAAAAADPMALFKKRFESLIPKIKEAIGAGGPAAQEIKLKASESGVFAKKKDFVQANRLLDEAEALLKKAAPASTAKPAAAPKAATPQKPAPKAAAPEKPAAAPTLTTYVKAKRDWVAAKAAATKNISVFKAAVLKECDPELAGAVKAKLDPWEGLVTVMDDSIILKIDKAIKEPDADRQADHNVILAKAFTETLAALRRHPFAPVADSNPFGKFFIRAPLEALLTKLVTTFSA